MAHLLYANKNDGAEFLTEPVRLVRSYVSLSYGIFLSKALNDNKLKTFLIPMFKQKSNYS